MISVLQTICFCKEQKIWTTIRYACRKGIPSVVSRAEMHNLLRIRGQKKKKDNVEGQSSAWMLNHVIKGKTLFFCSKTHGIHLLLYFIHVQIMQ